MGQEPPSWGLSRGRRHKSFPHGSQLGLELATLQLRFQLTSFVLFCTSHFPFWASLGSAALQNPFKFPFLAPTPNRVSPKLSLHFSHPATEPTDTPHLHSRTTAIWHGERWLCHQTGQYLQPSEPQFPCLSNRGTRTANHRLISRIEQLRPQAQHTRRVE